MKRKNILAMAVCLSLFLTPTVYAFDFSEFGLVDIHGFISQGYIVTTDNNWMGDTKDGTWEFNELGLNFTSMVTPRLRLGMQFFARDLGNVGNDEIILDWGYADYNIRDWFGIRVGQMKNPNGLYGELRDIDFLRTSVFLPQVMYHEGARDSFLQTKGAGIYGNIDARGLGMFRYTFLYGVTAIDPDGGTGQIFEEKIGLQIGRTLGLPLTAIDGRLTGTNVDKTYSVGLDWATPLEGLRLAGTYTRIEYSFDYVFTIMSVVTPLNFAIKQETWNASVEYSISDLIIAAEFLRSYYTGIHTMAWYTMATYRLYDWLAFGAYYGEFYDDEDDKHGRDLAYGPQAWQKTASIFVRFDINENWLVKAEYQYHNGVSTLATSQNLNAAGEMDFDRYWSFAAFKMTFNF